MSITKLKVRPNFPQASSVIAPVRLDRNQGVWKLSLDFSLVPILASLPSQAGLSTVFYDSIHGTYFKVFPLPTIIVTPLPLTVIDNVPVGTVVGYLSVTGGVGTYTYSLTSNPGGLYAISGNQLLTNVSPLIDGIDPITILADNGAGSRLSLNTTVTVVPVGYVPTYYIYGF